MDWLEFFDLVVPGFVACAEFGFFLFMRRGIRILSERDHVELEQRFLRTFNRIFPILTGLSVLLILVYALRFKENSVANRAVWAALFFFSAATVSWIWLNQSIQQEITGWDRARFTGLAPVNGLRPFLRIDRGTITPKFATGALR
jgi:hypothetical protein